MGGNDCDRAEEMPRDLNKREGARATALAACMLSVVRVSAATQRTPLREDRTHPTDDNDGPSSTAA